MDATSPTHFWDTAKKEPRTSASIPCDVVSRADDRNLISQTDIPR